MEGVGQRCGFLASHGVNHQQGFVGIDRLLNPSQFRHHVLVDLQASCCIDDDGINVVFLGLLQSLASNFDGIDRGS